MYTAKTVIKRISSIIICLALVFVLGYIVLISIPDKSDEPFEIVSDGNAIRMSVGASIPDNYEKLDTDMNVTDGSFCYLRNKSSGNTYKMSFANEYNVWFTLSDDENSSDTNS